MARVTKEEINRRLADTERHLISLGRVAAVQDALAKKYDVSRDTVRKWVARIRKQWAEEARKEEEASGVPLREARRLHIRQMLLDLHAQAQSRTEIVRDADGAVVMVDDGRGGKRPMVRPNPNYNGSLQCIRQLRALDALDQPKVKHVHHSGAIGTVDPDADRTEAEERFYLANGRWPTKKELAASSGA
jgi:hypothetical protein